MGESSPESRQVSDALVSTALSMQPNSKLSPALLPAPTQGPPPAPARRRRLRLSCKGVSVAGFSFSTLSAKNGGRRELPAWLEPEGQP